MYTSSGNAQIDGSNYKVITKLDLPRGRYLLTGKGQALNQQQTSDIVSCNVNDSAGRHLDASTVSVPSAQTIGTSSYGTLAFNAAFKVPSRREVRAECIVGGGTSGLGVSIRLSALRVRTVIDQS